ncbi:hypothetical protein GCM10027161_75090 [Microbispora hainanensis]
MDTGPIDTAPTDTGPIDTAPTDTGPIDVDNGTFVPNPATADRAGLQT